LLPPAPDVSTARDRRSLSGRRANQHGGRSLRRIRSFADRRTGVRPRRQLAWHSVDMATVPSRGRGGRRVREGAPPTTDAVIWRLGCQVACAQWASVVTEKRHRSAPIDV
jgi:hypothetical protein